MEQKNYNKDIIDEMREGPKSWMNFLIIGVNILIFLLVEATGSSEDPSHMISWGAADTALIQAGEYYRLFTCMFLHFGLEHLLNNMLLLFFTGYYLERFVGKACYLTLYLGGGLIGSLCSWAVEMAGKESVVSAGASGAIFAVLGALIVTVWRRRGQEENLSMRRLMLMVLLSVYVGFRSAGVDNAAHIGGLVGGVILALPVTYFKKRGNTV